MSSPALPTSPHSADSWLTWETPAALTYSTLVSATAVQNCIGDNNDICYAVGVPEASASANSGNIYFQIAGPTSQQWIALGTGQQMSGSYMFVMYQDGSGNVTISPRLGTNHRMPVEDTSSSAAQLTLLAGSGVEGNMMRANVRCANCQSWDGGSMDLSGTSNWIAAWRGGDSLATTDKNSDISVHDSTGSWQFDLSKATISSDANPFVASDNSGDSNSGSGSGSGSGSDSGSGSGSGSGNNANSGGIASGNSGVINNSGGIPKDTKKVKSAHGVIMAIVFVILYPLGSILMPLLGNWMAHAAFQFFNFVFMWVGFGLGYVLAQRTSIVSFPFLHPLHAVPCPRGQARPWGGDLFIQSCCLVTNTRTRTSPSTTLFLAPLSSV